MNGPRLRQRRQRRRSLAADGRITHRQERAVPPKQIRRREPAGFSEKSRVRALKSFERRSAGAGGKRDVDWVADVGWKYRGTPPLQAREGMQWERAKSGVPSPKEAAERGRRVAVEIGRNGMCARDFEG